MKFESQSFKNSLQNHDSKKSKIIFVDSSTSIEELKQIKNKSSYMIIVFDYKSRKK